MASTRRPSVILTFILLVAVYAVVLSGCTPRKAEKTSAGSPPKQQQESVELDTAPEKLRQIILASYPGVLGYERTYDLDFTEDETGTWVRLSKENVEFIIVFDVDWKKEQACFPYKPRTPESLLEAMERLKGYGSFQKKWQTRTGHRFVIEPVSIIIGEEGYELIIREYDEENRRVDQWFYDVLPDRIVESEGL